ncbi:hypothetical protein BC777_2568 [Yoonia maricola]|uniref:Uncharacterized protein n=1 Tax=Yoonia maricola TaxID=420999 RepID=A0A2M8W5M3_9RHOB|nr:hypothetical protein [Yoonia maricola]PJI86202.1 hypothetical protein BC777_2568 [Yoonia maricola]
MLDPKFFTDPDDMRRLHILMIEPSPARTPAASIRHWGIVTHDDGTLRMQGVVSGYPKRKRDTIVTGPMWQLNMPKRLMRTTKRWIKLERGYHEDVPADIEIEAIGPEGHYIAPCVANRYLELVLGALSSELDIS